MTGKLAKQTVKETYPEAVCRFGWRVINGVRNEYYEIYPNRTTSGRHVGNHYYSPTVLGKSDSKADAWVAAAEKIIMIVDVIEEHHD